MNFRYCTLLNLEDKVLYKVPLKYIKSVILLKYTNCLQQEIDATPQVSDSESFHGVYAILITSKNKTFVKS